MPVFEKNQGGEVLLRGIGRNVTVGDQVSAEDGFAEFLEERGDFELVEDVIDAEYREVDDEAEADSDDDQADGEFDVDAFLDRTPVDDVEEDIHAGEADEHLDTVAEAADRVTVETAVGERRAELAEEE